MRRVASVTEPTLPARAARPRTSSGASCLQTLDQRLRDGLPVRAGGELCSRQERRRPILVDGDHGPRALDARHVLARARDPEGEIELGGDCATALADLTLPRDPPE